MSGRNLSRREFLKGITVGVAGLSAAGAWAADGGMKYRTLGRTGLKVSELGFGTSVNELSIPILAAGIERGVNYVDTSPNYGRGKSEETLGELFKGSRVRDRMILCTKTSGMKLDADVERELPERVEASLKRMRTDYLDILMSPHGASRPEQVQNAAVFGAFEKLKKQGKARFFGVSIHTNAAETALAAIQSGYYDVVMTIVNVCTTSPALMAEARALREAAMQADAAKGKGKSRPPPEVFDMRPVLAEAVKKNVGIVAMKAVGAVPQAIRDKAPAHFGQASGMNVFQMCYKWALSQEGVAVAVAEMTSLQMLEENLQVPHQKLALADREMLERAVAAASTRLCRMCGTCSAHCPRGVKVADILRYGTYATYAAHESPADLYRALAASERASHCQDCGACEAACPAGVAVRARLREAHRRLA
ncbi:MAG: 4Fe-4S dicluster domain-containing protein [Planctomycetes bacterium]|nr:4Fe-4S dicluster domain-containing protein [Planctomycetota bacterium]